ncbi:unnamed protein product [Microthlaspi erraticum]|uniref:GH3 auxin-responsive promoter n=1 Tax=Microthlaspi erraticum TaxID=1685480 RepID=A0A6D2I6U2_9BRAS|nr:unnamed protein product [Microthlaspi erraticum]
MINLTEKDAGLAVLEGLTSNVKQIQDAVLKEILTCDANTEYLRSFLHGSSDKELFKKNVPIGTYEDFKPYIERVANGEPSEIISGKPIIGFMLTSGTSGGKQKLIPLNNKYLENARLLFDLRYLVLSTHVDGHNEGKGMQLIFLKPASKTPSGLPASYATTYFMKSDYYVKNLPSYWDTSSTSPSGIKLCPDNKQSLYCHLLCGLVMRDEVTRVCANFASILVQGITFLENFWREMCSNIRSGQLSDWITDLSCKDSVSMILGGPNPRLAYLIEDICDQKSWKGIIPQLWPKTKFIECIVTGQMAQHVPILEFYANDLPLVSPNYASSEAMFGVNLDPLCKPQDVSYTFMPNMSYFEFLPVGEGNDTIVDLANVKLDRYYELVVTNYAGLHRYRVGDVLQVTGFYNSAPQFRFVRRQNVVLSVYLEATTEEDLLEAVTRATQLLKPSGLMLRDFTCYPHISEAPGHYVLYWELKGNNDDGIKELDSNMLVECCSVVEESLDALYRRYRSKEGSIGALEIRIVQQGTFDSLMEYFIAQGASLAQYKTPRCLKSPEALQVLENRVLACFFSDKLPPC